MNEEQLQQIGAVFDSRVSQNLVEALADLDDAVLVMNNSNKAVEDRFQKALFRIAHAHGLLRSNYTLIHPNEEISYEDGQPVPVRKSGLIKSTIRNILP